MESSPLDRYWSVSHTHQYGKLSSIPSGSNGKIRRAWTAEMNPPSKARPPSKPRREEKKAATREALLEAATKVFARQGYVAASVDEVAWETGMTKGAVYSNFDSK